MLVEWKYIRAQKPVSLPPLPSVWLPAFCPSTFCLLCAALAFLVMHAYYFHRLLGGFIVGIATAAVIASTSLGRFVCKGWGLERGDRSSKTKPPSFLSSLNDVCNCGLLFFFLILCLRYPLPFRLWMSTLCSSTVAHPSELPPSPHQWEWPLSVPHDFHDLVAPLTASPPRPLGLSLTHTHRFIGDAHSLNWASPSPMQRTCISSSSHRVNIGRPPKRRLSECHHRRRSHSASDTASTNKRETLQCWGHWKDGLLPRRNEEINGSPSPEVFLFFFFLKWFLEVSCCGTAGFPNDGLGPL